MAEHSPEDIALCTVVKAELYYGAYRSIDPQRNLQLLDEFQCLAFDERSAKIYGQIRAELASQGLTIGPHDLLIASIALSNRLVLVTNNRREFERVKGLLWEDWSQ